MRLISLAKQTGTYGLASILSKGINFLLSVTAFTYVFKTGQYGIYTEMYTYAALLIVLLTYGMETAFFRFTKKYGQERDVFSTAVWSIVATTSVFLIPVLVFRNNIGTWLGYPHAGRYVAYMGLTLACDTLMAIPFVQLRQQGKAFRFVTLKLLNVAVYAGVAVVMVYICPMHFAKHPDTWITCFFNPEKLLEYVFFSNLAASAFTIACLIPEWRQLRFRFDFKLWKEMIGYALPIMVLGVTGVAMLDLDRLMVKFLIPNGDPLSQMGIYGACAKTAVIMNLFTQAFRYAAEPLFFNQMDEKDAPETYAKMMRYFVIVCAFIYLGCVLFLDQLMILVQRDYRAGQGVVPILLMGYLFNGIFVNLSVWYKVKDKTRIGMYISIMGAVITIGLSWLLIPAFGYYGTAWAVTASYFTVSLISYFWGQKHYSIPYPVGRIFLYLGGAVLLCLPSLFIEWKILVLKLIYNVLAIGLYAIFILRMEPVLRGTLRKIKNKIK